ncbi:MAG: pilus assembly protein PilM [Candidatus Omnitrophota bacterium]|nr:pilus assembly protein PilM [Candidatus Omnitrophota bacterium]
MDSGGNLGIYFGLNGLNIAEAKDRKLAGHYFSSYLPAGNEEILDSGNVSPEIKATAALQKMLRDNKIEQREAFVALPSSEFIIRTFSMPFLAKDEISSAVEFEVRKYIPFKLEELIFDYQVSQFVEGRAKKLKIFFIGIKRNILEKYIYILQQTELKILSLEPHAVSLLRLFLMKRYFSANQTIVVVDINSSEGTIMIVEQGLPFLIRDFKLTAAVSSAFTQEADNGYSHLLNEIRVSLEYYRRQKPKGSINKLFFLGGGDFKKCPENLAGELKIAAVNLYPEEVLGIKDSPTEGLLAAYGVGLANSVKTSITVDLAKKRFRQDMSISRAIIEEALPLGMMVRSAVIALVLMALVSSFNLLKIIKLNTELIILRKAGGDLNSLPEEDLKSKIASYDKKIFAIQEATTLNLISQKIITIPSLMPQGVWLTALSLKFDNPDFKSVVFKGIAFAQDANMELNLINKFILNLKESANINKDFKKISLVSATQSQAEQLGGTSFEVNCR